MVRGGTGRDVGADGGAARRAAGVPVLRHARARRAAGRYSHDLLRTAARSCGPELLAQLGIAVGDAHPHRRPAVHDPRRHRAGAGPARRRLQLRLAGARRLRRSARDRPADVRQPRQLPDPAARREDGGRRADARAPPRASATGSSTPAPTGRPRTTSARTCMRAENYLSLVGFVIVVLGGIGVWSVTRVFVQQKIRSVAILKCLGATTRQVLATYVAAGAAARPRRQPARRRARGGGDRARFRRRLAAAFGGVAYGLTVSAVLQGVAVGLLVSLLFSLVPLLEVRRVKPLLLLRGGDSPLGRRRGRGRRASMAARCAAPIDWSRWPRRSLVSAALVGVAAWQAASLAVGADRLRRVRRRRAASCTAPACGARPRRAAAGAGAVVPAAARRPQPAPARQPDARHPARRRARQLLRPRRARAPGEPARRSSRSSCERGGAGHVPDRHPAGSGRRRARRSSTSAAIGATPRLIPVLRARVTGVRGQRGRTSRASPTCAAAARSAAST